MTIVIKCMPKCYALFIYCCSGPSDHQQLTTFATVFEIHLTWPMAYQDFFRFTLSETNQISTNYLYKGEKTQQKRRNYFYIGRRRFMTGTWNQFGHNDKVMILKKPNDVFKNLQWANDVAELSFIFLSYVKHYLQWTWWCSKAVNDIRLFLLY